MLRWFLPPLVACACQSPLSTGIEAYREARYADASLSFREVPAAELDAASLARFELYSGLNHLALGNLQKAALALTRVRESLERRPDLLAVEDQARLFAAWRALGRPPGRPLTFP